jgi:hypothetical protein
LSAQCHNNYYTSNSIINAVTANCGAPLDGSASSVLVMGYNDVALEGSSVNFTCSSGLVLTGPNSSTCMEDGNWEPDPSRSACRNHHQNITIRMSLLVGRLRCIINVGMHGVILWDATYKL